MNKQPAVGERVFAVIDSDAKQVRYLGVGVYEGDFPLPEDFVIFPGRPNPRIKLDSGDIVWGCECWWGPESRLAETLEGKTVINVTVADWRKERDELAAKAVARAKAENEARELGAEMMRKYRAVIDRLIDRCRKSPELQAAVGAQEFAEMCVIHEELWKAVDKLKPSCAEEEDNDDDPAEDGSVDDVEGKD